MRPVAEGRCPRDVGWFLTLVVPYFRNVGSCVDLQRVRGRVMNPMWEFHWSPKSKSPIQLLVQAKPKGHQSFAGSPILRNTIPTAESRFRLR